MNGVQFKIFLVISLLILALSTYGYCCDGVLPSPGARVDVVITEIKEGEYVNNFIAKDAIIVKFSPGLNKEEEKLAEGLVLVNVYMACGGKLPVLLKISPKKAEIIANARRQGELSIILRNDQEPTISSTPVPTVTGKGFVTDGNKKYKLNEKGKWAPN